jgi:dipeptidyl aminopeptidase/acylaminoacyl peptidase
VSVAAQPPPATEVYLLDLGAPAASRTWINISNNPGYDNQPSFLPDSSAVLFASDRGDGTDIFRYDIGSKVLRQLTHTTEAEYSPTVTPDGKGFSVVRVETDKTQRLWRFDLDGTNPRLVLEDVKPVGYHAWIDATHLALFVLGSPNSLYVADTTTGAAESVHAGIGRSILIRPGAGTVTFTTTGASPMIMEMDPKTRSVKPLRAPLQGSQDTAWSPDGHILYMATGSVIQSVDADRPEGKWAPAFRLGGADSSGTGPALDRITRMAVSRDGRWLAFVAEPRVP